MICLMRVMTVALPTKTMAMNRQTNLNKKKIQDQNQELMIIKKKQRHHLS